MIFQVQTTTPLPKVSIENKMTNEQIMNWMIEAVKDGHDGLEYEDRYIGVFIDHVAEKIEILGYFKTIDATANFLGVVANPTRTVGINEFLYSRFWKKTEAEYHLYENGVNLFKTFKPLKSWIIVGIEWDNSFERRDGTIENVS